MSSETEHSGHATKSILKPKHELNINLGAYNLYTKRASFKDDGVLQQFVTEMAGQPIISPPVLEQVIPIVTHDDDSEELSEEELAKRKEFERKRKEVATPEGLDIKAVLGHRISIPGADGDEDEDEEDVDGKCKDAQNLQKKDGAAGSVTSSPLNSLRNPQKVGEEKE
ncbi:expressed protein [Echinococcus multilocularis]|uniref:Expressed protein n=1 Tax=Echinococcus multilocularis TaxID=6211 RepID=A0A087VZZ1_ECHMU|nr:expressed protein [Echinococcus multilocularis]